MITRRTNKLNAKGFTLVELLLVMAIMLIIMGLVVVAFPGIGKAGNLTNGAQSFVDQLNLARQYSLAQDRVVEVRFYYLPGPTDGNVATGYRGMRVIVCDTNGRTNATGNNTTFISGANPGRVQRLPTGVVIYADNTGKFTSLLPAMTNSTSPVPSWPAGLTTSMKPTTGTETFPGGAIISYAAFQFKPNGGTSLDPLGANSDKWFMTFKTENDPLVGTTGPAKNFVTVLLDPNSGRARTYRP